MERREWGGGNGAQQERGEYPRNTFTGSRTKEEYPGRRGATRNDRTAGMEEEEVTPGEMETGEGLGTHNGKQRQENIELAFGP